MNREGLGVAQGLLDGVQRNRQRGLDDLERKRQHRRQDAADRRATDQHRTAMRVNQARFAALQRAAQEEGAAEFVSMLEQGADPQQAVARYNSYGINKIKPDTFQFDPNSGAVHYETAEGQTFDGTLGQMRKLVDAMRGPAPAGEGFTLSAGETRFDAAGNRIASVDATAGAGAGSLPADARMVEYLVGNGVFQDKGQAYAFVRMSQTSPVDAVSDYVDRASKAQEMNGLMPGTPGYKTPEQLQQDGIRFVREIQDQYMESFQRTPPGGLDDLGRSQPPARTDSAAPGTGGSPYAEGQELVDRNTGKRYIVKNGQPVPVEGG